MVRFRYKLEVSKSVVVKTLKGSAALWVITAGDPCLVAATQKNS